MSAPVISTEGLVCTSHPEATRVGVEVLRAGGNAVDAAIAANAVLGVVEPMMCGVGGDLMAIVWDARRHRLQGHNSSGLSPRRLTLEAVLAQGLTRLPLSHPLTWTVPGCVIGWHTLLSDFGTWPLRDLLAPAIRFAEEGVRVTAAVARDWPMPHLGEWEEARRVFLPGGRAPRAGEVFVNHDLAETLRRIAADWRDFYAGEIAGRIDAFSRRVGGALRAEDLADPLVERCAPFAGRQLIEAIAGDPAASGVTQQLREDLQRTPRLLSTEYRGVEVFALPPNTQGLCVLQMLNMLQGEDLGRLGWGTAETLHRLIEAKKMSFEDRARHIADPRRAEVPVETLISKAHARRRWRRFDPDRAGLAFADDLAAASDTTYLCAADRDGNAISLIQSLYKAWGSGAVPDGLGFCLQNRGLGFSLDPAHPCCVAPLKRPLHTIIPGFAMRAGQPWLCFGVMGGTMQPQGQVQILTNLIDFGMDVQGAGEAPRWRHEGSSDVDGHVMRDGGEVFLEPGFSGEAVAGLRARGHRIAAAPQTFGGYQGILFDHARGAMLGGSDPRKGGCAMAV